MKKNLILTASVLLATLIFTASCKKDEEYVKPVFDSITLSPNPCHVGDKVTATVTYASKGDNWYYYKQTFTLGSEFVYNKYKTTGATLPDPPTCEFEPPAAGTYTVRFSSRASITAGEKLYEDLPSVSAKLTVLE